MSQTPIEQLTMEKKIQYMDMMFCLLGFKFSEKSIYTFISLYDALKVQKGNLDLMSISKIIAEADKIFPSQMPEPVDSPKPEA